MFYGNNENAKILHMENILSFDSTNMYNVNAELFFFDAGKLAKW